MSEIVTEKVAVTTTGSPGSASGSAVAPSMNGVLLSVYVEYHASAPVTTDLTIAYQNRGGTILALSNNATSGLYCPVKQTCDNVGAAVSGVYQNYPLGDALTVVLAQCDALAAAATVYFTYLRAA